jgi:hypothetical protein
MFPLVVFRMSFSCAKCSKDFKIKSWFDKHLAKCTAEDGDETPPSISDMYKMICSMKKEIDSLKKTVAKYERGGVGGTTPSLRGDRNNLIETEKLLPIDVCYEDWAHKLSVTRDDIYEIIRSGHIQGIITVMWNKIESIEHSPICIYNNTVMVYSKSGWKRITKSLLSIATQNIQSQISGVFETECPELSNIDSIDFNFDAYMKNMEILLAQSPTNECFMKCLLTGH